MLNKFLHPSKKILFLCIILTVAGLVYCLGINYNTLVLRYVVYFFSTYTLIIVCAALPGFFRFIAMLVKDERIPVVRSIKRLVDKYEFSRKFVYDADYRTGITMYTSLGWNLIYALFKVATGWAYGSLWTFGIGMYYMVLGFNFFHLLRSNRRYAKQVSKKRAYMAYKRTGILLLVLDLTMLMLLIQMLYRGNTYSYPGIIIYVSALYTFYSFITAFINIIKWHKHENPILTAAKNVSFSGACMSVLALQTAMITRYGGGDKAFQWMMNSVTGGIILLFIMGMGAFMVWRGAVNMVEAAKEDEVKVCKYDPAVRRPVICASICTGEQVAGFKNLETGTFEDIMLIRNESDIKEFKKTYGITEDLEKLY